MIRLFVFLLASPLFTRLIPALVGLLAGKYVYVNVKVFFLILIPPDAVGPVSNLACYLAISFVFAWLVAQPFEFLKGLLQKQDEPLVNYFQIRGAERQSFINGLSDQVTARFNK